MPMNARLLRPRASGLNPDAIAWRNAVFAAGSSVSGSVVSAVSGFITGCQSDGIWDAMKSVVLLAGADTLTGALVPLKGTAPTSYNFASGDYSKTAGLKGNGSSTYLDSNRANTADPLDDNHNVVYITTASNSASATAYMGNGNGGPGLNQVLDDPVNNVTLVRNRTSAGDSSLPDGLTGFLGTSRISSAGYTLRGNGSSATITAASAAIESSTLAVFARRSGGSPQLYSPARLSFYSIGESLDLTLLDARVSALMTAIGVS